MFSNNAFFSCSFSCGTFNIHKVTGGAGITLHGSPVTPALLLRFFAGGIIGVITRYPCHPCALLTCVIYFPCTRGIGVNFNHYLLIVFPFLRLPLVHPLFNAIIIHAGGRDLPFMLDPLPGNSSRPAPLSGFNPEVNNG